MVLSVVWCLCVQFFSPIEPLHIDIELTRGGQASGDAVVEFDSETEVREAMKRHREMIGQLSLMLFVTYYYYYHHHHHHCIISLLQQPLLHIVHK